MGDVAPWLSDAELRERREAVDMEVEVWARALCRAYGVNADTPIGNPAAPRWRSFIFAARKALEAKKIVEGGR